jgi:hypothetical protein
MFATIRYVNGTQQTIANVTNMSSEIGRNVGSIEFYDSQGSHTIHYELDKVESVLTHSLPMSEMKPLWHV